MCGCVYCFEKRWQRAFFYCIALIPIKRLFYIHHQNKKYLILLFHYHLKSITARLWTREERKRIFQRSFIIFLLSLIERKRLINIVTMRIFRMLIVWFHLSRAFFLKKEKFNLSLLNSTDQDLRKPQFKMLYGVFRQMAEYSNNNLKRNDDFLLVKSNKKADNISWVGASKQRFDSSLYKLTYWTDWHT